MSHRGSTLPGDDPRIITAQGTVSSETASSASRISNTNRTIPLKYLDLSNLPDEGTPYASTEIFSDVAQTNMTPGITTWIKHLQEWTCMSTRSTASYRQYPGRGAGEAA